MSFHKYLFNFAGYYEEIEGLLSNDDINLMFDTLRTCTKDDWEKWIQAHNSLIIKFISQTPSQRKNKTPWHDAQEKRIFLTATLVVCRRARFFLKAADEAHALIGKSYLEAFSDAAEQACVLHAALACFWPFSGETPWGEQQSFDPKYNVCMGFSPVEEMLKEQKKQED